MDIRVCFTGPDGGLCIMHVIDDCKKKCKPKKDGETCEDFALRVAKEDAPEGSTNFAIYKHEEIPMDRTFRNAWKQDLTPSRQPVEIDMCCARKIHLNRIRKHRNECLKNKDLEVVRALEEGDEAKLARIKRKKRKLRDLPANLELALDIIQDPDELKKYVPDELVDEGINEIEPIGGEENPNK